MIFEHAFERLVRSSLCAGQLNLQLLALSGSIFFANQQ